MKRKIALPLLALGAVCASFAVSSPASAHGYVSSPPSRQAMCAQGRVANCGDITFEPQSVEGEKGLTSCSGGNARFAQLDDASKAWPATPVGNSVTFNWVLTARHATSTWEYFIGGTKIASFDDGGKQPNATVSHNVSLAGRSGRQMILAVWNIADTPNAFYSCIDVQIGGGGGNPAPTPTATPTAKPTSGPTAAPTAAPTPAPTATATASTTPAQPGGTWVAGTAYKVGDRVTYGGATYQCRQAHTALTGWEPPNTPALWLKV